MKYMERELKHVTELKPGDHLCLIFENEEEHRHIIAPYLREGLRLNEKVFYITDTTNPEIILGYLRDEGIDPGLYLKSGQLTISTYAQTYMREGEFVPERMIALLQQEIEKAVAEGYRGLRATGELSWATRGLPGSERLFDYEAKLNLLTCDGKFTGLCQYDRRCFSPEHLMKVLATHPLAILGTEICSNFYYMPPAEFLRSDLEATMLQSWMRNQKERRYYQEKYLESEEQRKTDEIYRAILQTSALGFWMTDMKGNILEVNRAYCELTGYRREELIGIKIQNIEAKETGEETEQHIRLVQERGPDHFETCHRRRDGKIINVEINVNYADIGEGRLFVFINDITGKKQAEETILRSRESLAEAQRIARLGNFSWNIPTGELYRSEELYRIFGRTSEEMEKKPFELLRFVHPGDRENVKQALDNALNNHTPYSIEYRVVLPDGSIRHIHAQAEVTCDSAGRALQMHGTVLDITKRKKAEEEVRAVQERFSTVLDMLPAYIILLAPDYHIPFTNRFFRERFGESHGRRCFDYLFGKTEPCENCESYKPLKTNSPHEWEWLGPDDHNYYIYDFPFPERDGTTFIMEVGIDITEQKKAEARLRDASLYTRSLIETSLDPLVTISAEGKIMDVNRATELATGVKRDRLIGTDFSDYFTEPEEARKGYQLVFSRGSVTDYPLAIRHSSGRITDVLYNASLFRSEDGEVQGVFAAARDVTDRKKAEEELKQTLKALENSNRELEQFAYIASHDLQEPLRKITSFGEKLKSNFREELGEKGRDYLDRMVRAARRMSQLIEGLLRFSRLGTQPQRVESVNLNRIAEEVLSDLEINIAESKAAIEVRELPRVVASRLEMRQVVQNLMSNSIKFRRPGEQLRVVIESGAMSDGFAEIAFRDNGIGFDEKYLDRIFKPFQRLQPGNFEGVGMGLAICHKIITRCGGTITAKSQPGLGSTFIITLPAG